MLIDLVRLKNDIDEYINIDFKYSFGEEFLKQTDLIKLDDVSIKGEITKNSLDDIELHLKIDGHILQLLCYYFLYTLFQILHMYSPKS